MNYRGTYYIWGKSVDAGNTNSAMLVFVVYLVILTDIHPYYLPVNICHFVSTIHLFSLTNFYETSITIDSAIFSSFYFNDKRNLCTKLNHRNACRRCGGSYFGVHC
jgi:hypothetical protein